MRWRRDAETPQQRKYGITINSDIARSNNEQEDSLPSHHDRTLDDIDLARENVEEARKKEREEEKK